MEYTYNLSGEQVLAFALESLSSVEQLSCYDNYTEYDGLSYKFNKLLITSIRLEDSGLKGITWDSKDVKKNPKTSQRHANDAEQHVTSSFGSSSSIHQISKQESELLIPLKNLCIGRSEVKATNALKSEANSLVEPYEKEIHSCNRSQLEPVASSSSSSQNLGSIRLSKSAAAGLRVMLSRKASKYWFQRFSLFSRFKDTEFYTSAFKGLSNNSNNNNSNVIDDKEGHFGNSIDHNKIEHERRREAALQRLEKLVGQWEGGSGEENEEEEKSSNVVDGSEDFMDLKETILLDDESWWSVTPEVLARHQALHCRELVLAGRHMLASAYPSLYGHLLSHEPPSSTPSLSTSLPTPSSDQSLTRNESNAKPKSDRESCNSPPPSASPLEEFESTAAPWIQEPMEPLLVVEGCCGCGGNAIQFAAAGGRVTAIDNNRRRIAMAKHNAQVYGMHERCDFRCADFFAYAAAAAECVMRRVQGSGEGIMEVRERGEKETAGTANGSWPIKDETSPNVVFFSPPWGGPKYCRYDNLFDVSAPLPGLHRSLSELLPLLASLTEWRQDCVIAVFLPKNVCLKTLNDLVPEGVFWEVERNFINGKLKGITVYMRPPIYSEPSCLNPTTL